MSAPPFRLLRGCEVEAAYSPHAAVGSVYDRRQAKAYRADAVFTITVIRRKITSYFREARQNNEPTSDYQMILLNTSPLVRP
jgi:hypothetical protein